MLDAVESRAILPVEMSVENQRGSVACAMARFACQPVFASAISMVAGVMTAVSSPIQHKQ
jgi:hypothetical protein